MEQNNSFQPEFEANEEEETSFWLTIGDLMSGLLMVFVLLLLAVLFQMLKKTEGHQNQRQVILKQLEVQLKENSVDVLVDPKNGTITIKESILFAPGESSLRSKGLVFLRRFIPLYSRVLLRDKKAREEISRIVVEGHTDRDGSFASNLELSMQRALRVATFVLSDDLKYREKNLLRSRLLCSGRGEIEANQSKTVAQDRKVVFRIQFRDIDFMQTWGKAIGAKDIKRAAKKLAKPAPARRKVKPTKRRAPARTKPGSASSDMWDDDD